MPQIIYTVLKVFQKYPALLLIIVFISPAASISTGVAALVVNALRIYFSDRRFILIELQHSLPYLIAIFTILVFITNVCINLARLDYSNQDTKQIYRNASFMIFWGTISLVTLYFLVAWKGTDQRDLFYGDIVNNLKVSEFCQVFFGILDIFSILTTLPLGILTMALSTHHFLQIKINKILAREETAKLKV